jgi:hypothetical protein
VDGPRVKRRLFGPWRGLNENAAECAADECEDAWNVDFADDFITTRGGRARIVDPTLYILPSKAFWDDPGAEGQTRHDGTASLLDGPGFDLTGIGPGDQVYIGFATPMSMLYLEFSQHNEAEVAVTAEYFGANGWTALPDFVDGTNNSGTVPFEIDGEMTWTEPADWIPWGDGGVDRAYFIRLTLDGTLDPAPSIERAESVLNLADVSGTINGAFVWHRNNGQRWLIVGVDDKARGIARLFVLDPIPYARPFLIRGGGSGKSGPDARWRFAMLGDCLVACNGYTLLHTLPANPRLLVPFESPELREGTVLENDPPADARFVEVHNGALYVTRRSEPNRVRISAPWGDHPDIKDGAAAPLGGANLWNKTSWFLHMDPSGGGIVGLRSAGYSLLALGPRSLGSWQGDYLNPASSLVNPNVGCIAPESIASVADKVFFLSDDGVCAWSGGQVEIISHKVRPTLDAVNPWAASGACGVVYQKKNQYRLHVPVGPDGRNNLVLVYDYRRNTWTKYGTPTWLTQGVRWQPYEVAFACVARGSDGPEELLEIDYEGQLWRGDCGELDALFTVLSIAVTHRIKLEDHAAFRIRNVRVGLMTGSAGSVWVAALGDGASWRTSDPADSSKYVVGGSTTRQELSQLPDPSEAVTAQCYGSAAVEGVPMTTGVWHSRRLASRGASFGQNARYFNFVLHTQTAAARVAVPMKVNGLEAEFTVGDAR